MKKTEKYKGRQTGEDTEDNRQEERGRECQMQGQKRKG